MSSHSPVGDMAIKPLELRLVPAWHAYSDRKYTRRESGDHCALSHPVQPSRSLGRRPSVASTRSRDVIRPSVTATMSIADAP